MKAKNIIIIVCCLVVGVFLASMVGFMTNGFDKNQDNWEISQLNDDNYFNELLFKVLQRHNDSSAQ